MEELINLQELNNDNRTHYLEVFNNLTDEEIISFFDNEKGKSEIKSKLLELAKNRINKLPTPIFIEVSTWAINPNSYLNNYLERIEKMTYEEFVDLLFNGIYEPDIAIELAKKDIYEQHLQKEKKEQKEKICNVLISIEGWQQQTIL